MQVTVTNTSGHIINTPDLRTEGAVGGAKIDPLPYPFEWVGPVADSGTSVQQMHPWDLYDDRPRVGQTPHQKFQQLVQDGTITFAVADPASGTVALDEIFINEV